MTENNYLLQTKLAERWQVAETTLERWRSEGIGHIYLSLWGAFVIACPISRTLRRTHLEAVRLSAHRYATTGGN